MMHRFFSRLGWPAAVIGLITLLSAQSLHSPLQHVVAGSTDRDHVDSHGQVVQVRGPSSQACGAHIANATEHDSGTPEPGRHSHDCELCQFISQSLETPHFAVLVQVGEGIEHLSIALPRTFRLFALKRPHSRGPPLA